MYALTAADERTIRLLTAVDPPDRAVKDRP